MSIFDVARYLSYSKSVDYFDGSIRSFDLQKVDCKRSLNDIIEKQKPLSVLINEGFEESLVRDIYKKIKSNEYKRKQAPPALRVSSKAFGIGRRLPIVNNFNG